MFVSLPTSVVPQSLGSQLGSRRPWHGLLEGRDLKSLSLWGSKDGVQEGGVGWGWGGAGPLATPGPPSCSAPPPRPTPALSLAVSAVTSRGSQTEAPAPGAREVSWVTGASLLRRLLTCGASRAAASRNRVPAAAAAAAMVSPVTVVSV